MILRKKKQEIPLLTTQFGQPTKPLRDRLEALTKCVYTAQWMWEELWKHYGSVEITVNKNGVLVTCSQDTRATIKKLSDEIRDALSGWRTSPQFNKISASAPNLPDALALALLKTIGQRKEDGKK